MWTLSDGPTDPRWRPDAGPAAPHSSASATVVGARRPLIALIAMIDTGDLAGARAVAAAIRERSPGGLVHFLLRHRSFGTATVFARRITDNEAEVNMRR